MLRLRFVLVVGQSRAQRSSVPPIEQTSRVTRLAPSPTGALHLGNARTFLVNWAIARQRGWTIVLRIEDLDTPRVKPETIKGVPRTLEWLGLDWDQGPVIQSDSIRAHERALEVLRLAGLVYPCVMTRTQIEAAAAASAPHQGTHEVRFGPELRPAWFERGGPPAERDLQANWRFACEPGLVRFEDRCAGVREFDPAAGVGDFLVWTKRGAPSYQLAVVVDDHHQDVTDVVRGDDLLDSAARQLLLYRALRLAPEPGYWHLPLVLGQDRLRLAKRHGDTRVDSYRERGVSAEAVIGLAAYWCGTLPERECMSAAEFVSAFRVDTIPQAPITFTAEDEAWLLATTR